jgi:7,8-dihydropterin-6-yl-methyl-4-(beta-D-ribofuranosyl)aminobenzene 5'-phosphate synthase
MKKIVVLGILMVIAICLLAGISIFMRPEHNKGEQIIHNEKENVSAPNVKNLTITVVYDNNRYEEGIATAWGFSCLIKGTEKTILFDTGGDGSILIANMGKLEINPEEVEVVVLSHIHGDHVGGLFHFLEINPEVAVYLPQSFPRNFKDEVKRYGAEVVEVQQPLNICENVFSTGELGTELKEQSLIIQTDEGLIVITGCAHPGIVKIIGEAKDLAGDDLLFVMGGFHLAGTSENRIEEIISNFKELEVRCVGPCHCSGDTARQLFATEYKTKFIEVGAGRVITMEDLR